jgi:hypothetical protein
MEAKPFKKLATLLNGFSPQSSPSSSTNHWRKSVSAICSRVLFWRWSRSILSSQHLFKVTSDDFPKWFYYLWSKHHLDEFVSISSSHATTMGHIKRGDLDDAMVLIPLPRVQISLPTVSSKALAFSSEWLKSISIWVSMRSI